MSTLVSICAEAKSVHLASSKSHYRRIEETLALFVSIFGDALIDKSEARTWARCLFLRLEPVRVEDRLDKCLAAYSDQLLILKRQQLEQTEQELGSSQLSQGLDQVSRHAIYLFRRCQSRIRHSFVQRCLYPASFFRPISYWMKKLNQQVVDGNDSSHSSEKSSKSMTINALNQGTIHTSDSVRTSLR